MLKDPEKCRSCVQKPVSKAVGPMPLIGRAKGPMAVAGVLLFMMRSLPTFLSTSHAASGDIFFRSRSIFSIEWRNAESLLTRREIRL